MKKIRILILIIFVFLLVGCNVDSKNYDFNFTIQENFINMIVGEQYTLNYNIENVENPNIKYQYSLDGIINIEDNIISAISDGEVLVTASLTNNNITKEVNFTVSVERPIPETIEINKEIEIVLGETYQLQWKVYPETASQDVLFQYLSRNILEIDDNGLVTTLGLGTTSVVISVMEDTRIKTSVNITVIRPAVESIKTNTNIEINYKESKKINYEVKPVNSLQEVIFESMNSDIATVDEEGNVYGNCPGTTIVKIKSLANENIITEVTVTVKGVLANELNVENNIEVTIGEEYLIAYDVESKEAYPYIYFISEDESAIEVGNNGLMIAKKAGTYYVIAKTIDGSNIEKRIKIIAKGNSIPTFNFYNCTQDDVISINDEFNPLDGVRVFDAEDGEIIDIVVSGEVNNKINGTYVLTYKVIDSDLNEITMIRNIKVGWNYSVQFIGHAGSYYGLMNSEEAILYAITELKYTCVEIDVKQTKDGVFVLCHDDNFGDYTLASTNWETLKDYKVSGTRNAGYPKELGLVKNNGKYTAGLCTLKRFLEICKQYEVTAVIELKYSAGINNSSQSRMSALMDEIKKTDMLDNVIFLASAYQCLIWLRNNGYENIPCQYLVNSCENETYLQRCIDYNFDISINVTGSYINSVEWIKKYKDAGCKVSTFTFTQYVGYETVQAWIDKGVDFVTCDWHDMTKLNLPENEK